MRSNSSNAKMYAFATVFLIFFIALSILSLNVVKYRMFNSSKVMGIIQMLSLRHFHFLQ